MKNEEMSHSEASDFKLIGGVKLPLDVWSRANTYKTRQRVKGRRVRITEAVAELTEKGLQAEGIL